MDHPTTAIINSFARSFAQKGRGKGMTADEILKWFRRYSNNIVNPEFYGTDLTKEKLFHFCVERLHVEDQYRALIDLCLDPPESVNVLPDQEEREVLLNSLFSVGGPNGLALSAAKIESWEIRRQWIKVVSRLEKSPDAAVTAARTMIETTCKVILKEHTRTELQEGDLGRLVKEACKCLKLSSWCDSIRAGIGSILNGIAQVSNEAGDRHGSSRKNLLPLKDAHFIVNLAFSLSLFLLESRKESFLQNQNERSRECN
jgi:hypothetical protein